MMQRASVIDPQNLFSQALAQHQAGRLAPAGSLYRQCLAQDPAHPESLHLLGVLDYQGRRHERAVTLIRRALHLSPADAAFHAHLAAALHEIPLLPDAAHSYRRALTLNPANVDTLNGLGTIAQDQAAQAEAAVFFQRTLLLQPDLVEAYGNLGNVWQVLHQLDDAIACYVAVLLSRPALSEVWSNLGAALRKQKRNLAARDCLSRALKLSPDYAAAHYNMGNSWRDDHLFCQAILQYRRAITLMPAYLDAYQNLGTMLLEFCDVSAARRSFQRTVLLQPTYADGLMSMGFAQLYQTGIGLADILAQARQLDRLHPSAPPADWRRRRGPDAFGLKPRLGFISADFFQHPVGEFLAPVVEGLSRGGTSVTCYNNGRKRDQITRRFIAASQWRDIADQGDEAVLARIADDQIDILIDLSGFSAGTRLLLMTQRPAPLQFAGWVGYPATCGLAAIDYLIADPRQVPTEVQAYYSEKIVCLPHSYVCFEPPPDAPDIGAPPALASGHITFGSFNALKKIGPEVIALWSRILMRLPDSRLLLKAVACESPEIRRRIDALFAAHGVAPQRVHYLGATPPDAHLKSMLQADIALDSFPYSGGRTTVESLWMGLPVVTMPGVTFSSRHSLSYLTTIGLTELVAVDADAYVDIAVGLAADLPRLTGLRDGIRRRMLNSPLCDVDGFVRDLDAALNRVWQEWLAPAVSA